MTKTTSINIRDYLFEPISGANLGLFRIAWGAIMFYFFGKLVLWTDLGKFRYIEPIFHFKYPGYEWVEPLPAGMMYFVLYLGCGFAVLTFLGLFYRFASIGLAIVFSYVFLLDVSYWNNHYYAYVLVAWFFAVADAHQIYSIDKYRLKLVGLVPRWQLYLFRFQFLIIYFYGGLSKLQNKDWLTNLAGYSLVENSFVLKGWAIQHHVIYPISMMITWGGLCFDLFIGALLLYRKTLWLAFVLVFGFNMTNAIFLQIGTFPYTMLLSFILFIPPTTLHKVVDKLVSKFKNSTDQNPSEQKKTSTFVQYLILGGLICYVAFQVLFPLRSLTFPGSVFWTKEGKLYSWHMMSGSSDVYATLRLAEMDEENLLPLQYTDLELGNYLSDRQIKTLGIWPILVPQFARFIKKEAELSGFKNVRVYGEILVGRNKRPLTHIINPNIDLATVKTTFWGHNDWILRYVDEDGFFRESR